MAQPAHVALADVGVVGAEGAGNRHQLLDLATRREADEGGGWGRTRRRRRQRRGARAAASALGAGLQKVYGVLGAVASGREWIVSIREVLAGNGKALPGAEGVDLALRPCVAPRTDWAGGHDTRRKLRRREREWRRRARRRGRRRRIRRRRCRRGRILPAQPPAATDGVHVASPLDQAVRRNDRPTACGRLGTEVLRPDGDAVVALDVVGFEGDRRMTRHVEDRAALVVAIRLVAAVVWAGGAEPPVGDGAGALHAHGDGVGAVVQRVALLNVGQGGDVLGRAAHPRGDDGGERGGREGEAAAAGTHPCLGLQCRVGGAAKEGRAEGGRVAEEGRERVHHRGDGEKGAEEEDHELSLAAAHHPFLPVEARVRVRVVGHRAREAHVPIDRRVLFVGLLERDVEPIGQVRRRRRRIGWRRWRRVLAREAGVAQCDALPERCGRLHGEGDNEGAAPQPAPPRNEIPRDKRFAAGRAAGNDCRRGEDDLCEQREDGEDEGGDVGRLRCPLCRQHLPDD
mmetsp:Transcript_2840/g.8799  ORF Transcript_2840/g.8799 Transcript_2840/m.8799 type:complete len:514 (+) Transcript_2840:2088-3629(+)